MLLLSSMASWLSSKHNFQRQSLLFFSHTSRSKKWIDGKDALDETIPLKMKKNCCVCWRKAKCVHVWRCVWLTQMKKSSQIQNEKRINTTRRWSTFDDKGKKFWFFYILHASRTNALANNEKYSSAHERKQEKRGDDKRTSEVVHSKTVFSFSFQFIFHLFRTCIRSKRLHSQVDKLISISFFLSFHRIVFLFCCVVLTVAWFSKRNQRIVTKPSRMYSRAHSHTFVFVRLHKQSFLSTEIKCKHWKYFSCRMSNSPNPSDREKYQIREAKNWNERSEWTRNSERTVSTNWVFGCGEYDNSHLLSSSLREISWSLVANCYGHFS